jgi:uncharacterized protein YegL
MYGKSIDELNEGVKEFFNEIKNDDIARFSAEISVVTFGGTQAKVLLDFEAIDSQKVPKLEATGRTPMGSGVNLSLDLLENRKKEYSEAGVDYYQPWLVLMTDGVPTDSISDATNRTCNLISNKKLVIFPLAIGESADIDTLSKFSPKKPPIRLKELKFRDFFQWLSQSVSMVSRSTVGDDIELDISKISAWGSL